MQFSLKELRARKNMTQTDVAKAIGVSTQAYNAWEKDLSKVQFSKVVALANLFEVQLSELKM